MKPRGSGVERAVVRLLAFQRFFSCADCEELVSFLFDGAHVFYLAEDFRSRLH